MRAGRKSLLLLAALVGLGGGVALPASLVGSQLESFAVGSTTYRDVKILSVNARTVVIRHRDGITSIRLRDLSPEWQSRFNYDPVAEATAEKSLAASPPPPRPAATKPAAAKPSRFESLLQQFGKAAEAKPEVDLRPRYFKLELGVKNQGRRPSCAIFAVVSALELQHAELAGRPEKFSEEYLIWAVRQTVQRVSAAASNAEDAGDADAGYTLSEVVSALRAYGIPLQAAMPNTFGSAIADIENPPSAVVEQARTHQRVFVHRLPGRDQPTLLNNVVQALNQGVPIPVGMAWPNYRSLRTGYLSGQKPLEGSGHAVTLVGYKCPTGRIEEAVFVFKNSWGVQWGQGGYGTVTYDYLQKYLHEAIVLEVQGG